MSTAPFALTSQEPAPEKPPAYQVSYDSGQHWHRLKTPELERLLERYAQMPRESRREVDQGRTIALKRNEARCTWFVRRTPTAAEAADAARQLALLGGKRP